MADESLNSSVFSAVRRIHILVHAELDIWTFFSRAMFVPLDGGTRDVKQRDFYECVEILANMSADFITPEFGEALGHYAIVSRQPHKMLYDYGRSAAECVLLNSFKFVESLEGTTKTNLIKRDAFSDDERRIIRHILPMIASALKTSHLIPTMQLCDQLRAEANWEATRALDRARAEEVALERAKHVHEPDLAESQSEILDKQQPTKSSRSPVKKDKPTEARNKWVYEQCCKGTLHQTIALRLPKKNPRWTRITTKQGILACARKYAEDHKLPPPPSRQSK